MDDKSLLICVLFMAYFFYVFGHSGKNKTYTSSKNNDIMYKIQQMLIQNQYPPNKHIQHLPTNTFQNQMVKPQSTEKYDMSPIKNDISTQQILTPPTEKYDMSPIKNDISTQQILTQPTEKYDMSPIKNDISTQQILTQPTEKYDMSPIKNDISTQQILTPPTEKKEVSPTINNLIPDIDSEESNILMKKKPEIDMRDISIDTWKQNTENDLEKPNMIDYQREYEEGIDANPYKKMSTDEHEKEINKQWNENINRY